MRLLMTTLAAAAYFNATVCVAQTTRTARSLPSYVCMSLNITDAQAQDFKFHVPFYSAPDSSSRAVGFAGSQVAVRYPTHEVNGFVEALFPSGATAWIAVNYVRPYHSALDPTAKCVPVIMANGRQGFSYPH
jgi:hypothetical protein